MTLLRSTLVDLKNGLPPRELADRVHKRGIVFVHVPKCAGTSAETAIRSRFRLSRIIIKPEESFAAASIMLGHPAEAEHRQALLAEASELRRQLLHYSLTMGYKCITGHAPLGQHTVSLCKNSHDFVTILRNPLERYASHLAFNATPRAGHGVIEQPLGEFLQSRRAQVMGALYVKYFSGLPMDADFTTPEAIELAKANLTKMAVVGFLDQLDCFERALTALIGKQVKVGHANQGNKSSASLDIFGDYKERLEQLCTPDTEIFNWARTEFSAQNQS